MGNKYRGMYVSKQQTMWLTIRKNLESSFLPTDSDHFSIDVPNHLDLADMLFSLAVVSNHEHILDKTQQLTDLLFDLVIKPATKFSNWYTFRINTALDTWQEEAAD